MNDKISGCRSGKSIIFSPRISFVPFPAISLILISRFPDALDASTHRVLGDRTESNARIWHAVFFSDGRTFSSDIGCHLTFSGGNTLRCCLKQLAVIQRKKFIKCKHIVGSCSVRTDSFCSILSNRRSSHTINSVFINICFSGFRAKIIVYVVRSKRWPEQAAYGRRTSIYKASCNFSAVLFLRFWENDAR